MKNKIKQLEEELLEQCVLNGKGSEREAALLGKVERLERENAALREQINKKPVFEWCEDCELFRSCYVWDFKGESGQVIRGPNFISPSCSEEGD